MYLSSQIFCTTLSFIATCMNYIWSDTRFIHVRKSLWSHSQALVCGHESLGTRLHVGVHHLTKDLLQAYNARRCANPNLGWSFAHSKILSWSFTQVYLGKPLILVGQDQNYHVQCLMCHSNKTAIIHIHTWAAVPDVFWFQYGFPRIVWVTLLPTVNDSACKPCYTV